MTCKLRWLVLCNENGVKTEPALQYKESEEDIWEDIDYEEMKTWEYYGTERKDII